MIGPGSSKNRTRYTPSSVVLARILPIHHNPSSPLCQEWAPFGSTVSVSYTHLRAHETEADLVCRLLLEKKKRRTQEAQPNHTKEAPNPDIKIPKHLKQPRENDKDLKTQKTPGTTQGEKRRSQDAETTRNNPRRRNQKTGKLSNAAAA